MKKILVFAIMMAAAPALMAQFATYNYTSISDDMEVNNYKLTIQSWDAIEFWAELTAEGDTDNYKLKCGVTEGDNGEYIIEYQSVIEGDYWQALYMTEYMTHEEEYPVLFIVDQGVGEVTTTFKEFKIEGIELPEEPTKFGFEIIN